MTTETIQRVTSFTKKLLKNPLIKKEFEKDNIILRISKNNIPYLSHERPDGLWGAEYKEWKDKVYHQFKKEKLVYNSFYGYTTKELFDEDTKNY